MTRKRSRLTLYSMLTICKNSNSFRAISLPPWNWNSKPSTRPNTLLTSFPLFNSTRPASSTSPPQIFASSPSTPIPVNYTKYPSSSPISFLLNSKVIVKIAMDWPADAGARRDSIIGGLRCRWWRRCRMELGRLWLGLRGLWIVLGFWKLGRSRCRGWGIILGLWWRAICVVRIRLSLEIMNKKYRNVVFYEIYICK